MMRCREVDGVAIRVPKEEGLRPPANEGDYPRPRLLLLFLVTVSFIGFVISTYLTLIHYRGLVPRCYVIAGCDVVQASPYSTIIGVPIALFGTAFFSVMFFLGIGLATNPSLFLTRAYKLLAYLGALAVIPLFLVQAVIIKALCSYCLVTEIIMLSMWAMSFRLKGPATKPASAL